MIFFRLILISTLLSISISIFPASNSSFKNKIREFVDKNLGANISTMIFGEEPIELPPIPKIINNAKSTAVFKKNIEKTIGPSNKQKQKLDYLFLVELFEVTKLREPTDNDLSTRYNLLSQGGSREGIYRALVLGEEYYNFENQHFPITPDGLNFSIYFLKTYVGQNIKKNSIAGANFFSLKREIGERALSIIDLLAENKNHLSRWYAVLSGYLAKTYPSIWKTALRKNIHPEAHLDWANNVPIEHIKSETYIKLHKTMNHLSRP
jgi:hypothetical protein